MPAPRRLIVLALVAALAAAGPAQPPAPVQYADVLKMVKDEFKEEKIVRLVSQSPTRFVLSTAQTAELKAAGASQSLLNALANPTPALPAGTDVGAVVLILDCSGSMTEPVPGGGTKWAAAQQAARDLVDAVAEHRDVAFVVYGTDPARQCDSVDVLRPMGPATASTRAELRAQIDRLKPAGHTPIARSLEVAGEQLARTGRLAKVILITDGIETCHGDPGRVAAGLRAAHKHLQSVEVIGLGLKPEEKAAVGTIAKAGAGRFYDAQTAKGLVESVKQVAAVVAKAEPERGGGLTAAERAEFDLMHVFSRKNFGYPNGLHTEVLVNGTSAGVLTDKGALPIGRLLRPGENVLQFRTFCGARTTSGYPTCLILDVGPAHRTGSGLQMDRALWAYSNGADWAFQKGPGLWTHKADPAAKDATVTARVYFTGLKGEGGVGRDDYVLHAANGVANHFPPLTATAFINDVPVNSVFGVQRAVVITHLLRPGKNSVKLVARGLENHLGPDNPLKLSVGRGKFNAASGKVLISPLFTQHAEADLRRDDDNRWVSVADPKAGTVTYTHELEVDELPPRK